MVLKDILKRHPFLKKVWDQKLLLLMVLPCFVWLIVFCYIPMTGIAIAFQDFTMRPGAFYFDGPWVGFDNFILFFKQVTSWQVITNTLAISAIKLVFGFPIPIILALMINEIRNKYFGRTIQTIAYLPHFLSWVITMAIFTRLLSLDDGIINVFIESLGFDQINFMGDPSYVYGLSFFTEMWKEMGWNTIIYLAALTAIDPQLYEAAHLDGCSRFKCIWHIAIPSIRSTIGILLILASGNILNSNFDQLYLMQNPGNIETARVIDTYIYERITEYPFDYSSATAMSLMKSVINLGMLFGVNGIVKKLTGDSII